MKLVQIALIIVCVVGIVIGCNSVTWSSVKSEKRNVAIQKVKDDATRRGYRLVGAYGPKKAGEKYIKVGGITYKQVKMSDSERMTALKALNYIENLRARKAGEVKEFLAEEEREKSKAIQENLIAEQKRLEREEKNLRYNEIINVHPDFLEISNNQMFKDFINNLPEKDRKICNELVDVGSAEKVNALLTAYKQSSSAGHGDATVQFNLGEMYSKGQETEKDHNGAARWYLKAAEHGHVQAQNTLAFNYYMGEGVDQDYNEAAKWFLKAAEQGHVQAQFNLGYMYSKGQGVTQDYSKALEWYRKAANQKYAHAQNMLGSMYSKGQGVDQDYEESVKWYRMAAEQGNRKAQKSLSAMYSEGRGVEKNEKEAVKWRLKSIEKT